MEHRPYPHFGNKIKNPKRNQSKPRLINTFTLRFFMRVFILKYTIIKTFQFNPMLDQEIGPIVQPPTEAYIFTKKMNCVSLFNDKAHFYCHFDCNVGVELKCIMYPDDIQGASVYVPNQCFSREIIDLLQSNDTGKEYSHINQIIGCIKRKTNYSSLECSFFSGNQRSDLNVDCYAKYTPTECLYISEDERPDNEPDCVLGYNQRFINKGVPKSFFTDAFERASRLRSKNSLDDDVVREQTYKNHLSEGLDLMRKGTRKTLHGDINGDLFIMFALFVLLLLLFMVINFSRGKIGNIFRKVTRKIKNTCVVH